MRFRDWPWRLKGPQDDFFTTLALLLFADPGGGSFMIPSMTGAYPAKEGSEYYSFTASAKASRLEVNIPLFAIFERNASNKIGEWINRYGAYVSTERKLGIRLSKERSNVRVQYTKDGKKEYYVWYVATNSDGVPLMHLPTGEQFAVESY